MPHHHRSSNNNTRQRAQQQQQQQRQQRVQTLRPLFTAIEPITAEAEASIRKDLPRPSSRPLLWYRVAVWILLGSFVAGWMALVWLTRQDGSNYYPTTSRYYRSSSSSSNQRQDQFPNPRPLKTQNGSRNDGRSSASDLQKQDVTTSNHEVVNDGAVVDKKTGGDQILTVYMESPLTPTLRMVQFPEFKDCHSPLPVNDLPSDDPFLPWIHDYVVQMVDDDVAVVQFVAQNRRRCETGEGKEEMMQFWEPQIALFQAVPVDVERMVNGSIVYRLFSTPEQATIPETRFLCHFHDSLGQTETTFSQFPFNYEYVLWRKGKLPMFKKQGADVSNFELSQLLFHCPIPSSMQLALRDDDDKRKVYLDLVPIRTPPRHGKPLFTEHHVGPLEYDRLHQENELWDAAAANFGSTNHVLPPIHESGRWAHLPLCRARNTADDARNAPVESIASSTKARQHNLVACTWTSASYMRRGDAVGISDSTLRLKEWIVFHRLVGVDHIYVYDNTETSLDSSSPSPLRAITDQFGDFVTYIPWPHTVCSNRRPNHPNPGERSSQYAAEAACRIRYGPTTEWMTFLDTDEYIVPMRPNETWTNLLREMREQNVDIVKMRSSRGRPRIDYTETLPDPSVCRNPTGHPSRLPQEPCVGPRRNETFLRVYNCDYIRHPRPDRFERAMKQIYRPAYVLSHFVHYSTVTQDMARYYQNYSDPAQYRRMWPSNVSHERFLDELTQGALIHTKTVLPHETTTRNATCHHASKHTCLVGHACPDSTIFDDALQNKNLFQDEHGRFCNCWVDPHVENYWIPRLERVLAETLS